MSAKALNTISQVFETTFEISFMNYVDSDGKSALTKKADRKTAAKIVGIFLVLRSRRKRVRFHKGGLPDQNDEDQSGGFFVDADLDR